MYWITKVSIPPWTLFQRADLPLGTISEAVDKPLSEQVGGTAMSEVTGRPGGILLERIELESCH